MKATELLELAESTELLEVARRAVEDELVELRDARISILNRRNGLVIRERDGSKSSLIRLPIEAAMRIGLRAIAESLSEEIP